MKKCQYCMEKEATMKRKTLDRQVVWLCEDCYNQYTSSSERTSEARTRTRRMVEELIGAEKKTLSFSERINGFMFDPTHTFWTVDEEGWRRSIGYFAKLLLIFAILVAVIFWLFFATIGGVALSVTATINVPGLEGLGPAIEDLLGLTSVMISVFALISTIIGGIVGTLVGSLWIHIWVYAVGGRKGVGQTIKAMAYGCTPMLFLGWIPFIGLIFVLWSLAVSIIGIRELQEITKRRAALAYLFGAIIIPAIIVFALFSLLLTAFSAWIQPFT